MKKSFAIIATVVAVASFVVVDSINEDHKIIGECRSSQTVTAEEYASIEDSVNNALEAELSKLDEKDPANKLGKKIARNFVNSEMQKIKSHVVE